MARSKLPVGYRDRPVAIIGCGVLGRRIALIWANSGYKVNIFDVTAAQVDDALQFVQEQSPGTTNVRRFHSLTTCVENCWLVIEAIPEYLEIKIELFGELETLAPHDAILATNSSSFRSSLIARELSSATQSRTLNTHYHMPPARMTVELMTCGHTDEEIMTFMKHRQEEIQTIPYIVRQESTGFIINRVWAAVKREILTVLAEGVSTPAEIDEIWGAMMETTGMGPCTMMDATGLDTVAAIEQNYINERGLSSTYTVDFLRDCYLSHGRLGTKSGKGGFYPPSPPQDSCVQAPRILALDNGLGRTGTMTEGRILICDMAGSITTLVGNQSLPDGIDVDRSTGHMFWTCMGFPGKQDGAIYSANWDGTGIENIIPVGTINTPKQLCVDSANRQLYFADREGKRIYRCDYSGSHLEVLVDNNTETTESVALLATLDWCVGIAVCPKLGKIFWTQKGPSKGGMGRIFSADIEIPTNETASTRRDRQCIVQGLPEPIDLEIDEDSHMLYWTDRGELPFGNSVNCVALDERGLPLSKHTILVRNLQEAIGLRLDLASGQMFFADSGGKLYCSQLDGTEKNVVYSGEENFTGIALV